MHSVVKKRPFILSVICFVMLFSIKANASNLGFLKYAAITDFTKGDIELLQKEYLKVLNNKKPGDIYNWNNKETKNGGEITVIRQYKDNEKSCKRLKFKNHSSRQSGVTYFNFCLIDAQWKIVN